jgi:hypothetical protein
MLQPAENFSEAEHTMDTPFVMTAIIQRFRGSRKRDSAAAADAVLQIFAYSNRGACGILITCLESGFA